jgi:hypothetical protein
MQDAVEAFPVSFVQKIINELKSYLTLMVEISQFYKYK